MKSGYNPLSASSGFSPRQDNDERLRDIRTEERLRLTCFANCGLGGALVAVFFAVLALIGALDDLQDTLGPLAVNVSVALAPPAPAARAAPASGIDQAVAGMLRQDGYFTLFTDNSTAPAKVLLSVAEEQLGQPFLVSAMRQRADGFSHGTTLHYPGDQSLWTFKRTPGNDADPQIRGKDAPQSLDLALPQLAVRASATEPVKGPRADGVWTGVSCCTPIPHPPS
jgi:hypothetical protein